MLSRAIECFLARPIVLRMIQWVKFRVICGPVVLSGNVFRGVEAFTSNGGHHEGVEVWCGHQWGMANECPSFNSIKQMKCSTRDELLAFHLPIDEFPEGYNPLSYCEVCKI